MKEVIFDDALKGAYHDIDVSQPVEETIDYKQVATLGVGALVAAVFGILGFFWTPLILASLLGVILGILAQRKIMRAPEEMAGGTLTTVALILSALLFVSSTAWRASSCGTSSAKPGSRVAGRLQAASSPLFLASSC